MCGHMLCDENKTIRVCVCPNVTTTQRAMYKKEEFEAQNKSKASRVDQDPSNTPRTGGPSTQISGFLPMGSRKTISDLLDYGGRDDVDAKVFRFLYA